MIPEKTLPGGWKKKNFSITKNCRANVVQKMMIGDLYHKKWNISNPFNDYSL